MDKPAKTIDSDVVNGDTAEESPLKMETINVQNMTFREKIKYLKNNITVEPVLALFVMPSVLAALAMQNLNLDKACRVDLGFGDSVCTNLRLRKRDNLSSEEIEVQKLFANMQSWKSIVQALLPTILMLFMGSWSDKTGRRKICMIMPIMGEISTCILNIINTYFFYQVPVRPTVFMEVIAPALTGGWYTMFLGTFSYLGDITSKEMRTFRLGILSMCMTVGFPIGAGLSGVLLKYSGYYGVFAISACLQLINLCYVIFAIKDHRWLADKDKVKKSGCFGYVLEFFDFQGLKKTMEIVFKRGPKNRRLRICLILSVVCCNFGTMWGELSIMYIFCRYRFNWDEVSFSLFTTVTLITHSLGTLFSISVFSKRMKVDDAVLGIISTCSKIAGMLVFVFARTTLEVYFEPFIEILNGCTPIALRSIASKLVSYQELGKVYSLFGVAETMMPLIFAPLYSSVYIMTLHFLPGFPFLLSVLFTTLALGIFIWFYEQHKQDRVEMRLEMPITPPPTNADAPVLIAS